MPRERSPLRGKAKDIYINAKGNVKLKDIALELGVSDVQIRGWKRLDNWDNNNKTNNNVINKNVTKPNNNVINKKGVTVERLPDSALTEKQLLFCNYFIQSHNATKAYMKAYSCDYKNANANAYALWSNMVIKAEVDRQRAEFNEMIGLDAKAVIQKYIDIAFSDITDFLEFGKKEYEIHKENGGTEMRMFNFTDFKNSGEVDGTLISEVKQSKDGVSIKLQDKMKALEWLGNHVDILDTATKQKLELEKEKLKFATLKAGNDPDEESEDDGFIDALKGTVNDVWDDVEID